MTFREIFHDVYPALVRYARRMAGDPDAAEDAVQEAFVRLLDRDVHGEPERLRGWLFTTVTNLLRDRARVAANRSRLLATRTPMPETPPEAADRMERQERIRRVREALDALDARDRTLLLLREEGFSYRELAREVGVQPGSVGTLLARARRRFRDQLTEK